jgi:NADH:ubiquinone oxidoreductase subunit B-like Fe-S oxidoreductase
MILFVVILMVGLFMLEKGALEGNRAKSRNMGVVTTTLESVVNWSRQNSMWPMLFGWHAAPLR